MLLVVRARRISTEKRASVEESLSIGVIVRKTPEKRASETSRAISPKPTSGTESLRSFVLGHNFRFARDPGAISTRGVLLLGIRRGNSNYSVWLIEESPMSLNCLGLDPSGPASSSKIARPARLNTRPWDTECCLPTETCELWKCAMRIVARECPTGPSVFSSVGAARATWIGWFGCCTGVDVLPPKNIEPRNSATAVAARQ